MNCNHECSICQSGCVIVCPICGKPAREVKINAALNLVIEDKCIKKEAKIYICQNKKCDIVYFQKDNPKYYLKSDVKVPIWFKEKYDKYMVCYCRNIFLADIVKFINDIDDDKKLTKEDFVKLYPKIKEDCLHNNPLGESCDKLFANAIEYAYHIKKGE